MTKLFARRDLVAATFRRTGANSRQVNLELVAPRGACSYPRAPFRFSDSSGLVPFAADNSPVYACVIFNPVAKGDKARAFRKSLDTIASQCALKATAAAGDARRLAAAAI